MAFLTSMAGAVMDRRGGDAGPRPRGAWPFLLFLLAVGWLTVAGVRGAEETVASEYQVKAAFLINFPKYVDWPPGAFAGANQPIVIGVLGDTMVTAELQKIVAGRTVNGREFVVRLLASGAECGGCHILFIAAAEQAHAVEIFGKLKAGVLTVGESDSFLAQGGIINLALHSQKIAIEVNLNAAASARIKVGSKLLKVAIVVNGKTK